jgi:hypothetical protein
MSKVRMRALDTQHHSSVGPDAIHPGQEFEINSAFADQIEKSGMAERVADEPAKAKAEAPPKNKAEPAPANKQENPEAAPNAEADAGERVPLADPEAADKLISGTKRGRKAKA